MTTEDFVKACTKKELLTYADRLKDTEHTEKLRAVTNELFSRGIDPNQALRK